MKGMAGKKENRSKIEFRDLKRQYRHLKISIDSSIAEVVSSADFISGRQTAELERELAQYVGIRHCISCGNGTDAITIALVAYGIGTGDAVFVPDFTFFSTGECPAAVGAVPVFVDVCPDTYNMDSVSLEKAVKQVKDEGKLRPRAVIAVDLFGLPADYAPIRSICEKYGMLLLEDGAQGFGGAIGKRRACSFGDVSATSFFPAKPLGCYGDGGAIFTDDDRIAALCRSIAVHGKNEGDKYDNVRIGMNSRLDTLQAAILLRKLEAFARYELDDAVRAANMYMQQMRDIPGLLQPAIPDGFSSAWAQYAVQLPEGINRAAVQEYLKNASIPSMIYYAKPMHRQRAFSGTRSAEADCPVTEKICKRVLCLPMHPYLLEEEICFTAGKLKEAIKICREKN